MFFILKAKCPVIARDLGCEVGEMIFQKNKILKGGKVDAGVWWYRAVRQRPNDWPKSRVLCFEGFRGWATADTRLCGIWR
jgi:hypothetical protein